MLFFFWGHFLEAVPAIDIEKQKQRGAEIPQLNPSRSDLEVSRLPKKEKTESDPEETVDREKDEQQIIIKLKGIVLLKELDQGEEGDLLIDEAMMKEGISSQIPLEKLPEFQNRLKRFLDRPLYWKNLREIKKEIVEYFVDYERQAVRILIPPQEVSRGVLLVQLFKGEIGSVKVEGNRWADSQRLLRSFGFKSGDSLDPSALRKRLNYMNHSPFTQSDLILNAEDRSQITLQVKDRFPVRLFSGYEDSGSDITGDTRWYGGFNWGMLSFSGIN